MTLGPLLLTLFAAYLAVIAYGAVGARRKFAGGTRRIVQACLVILLPALIVGLLLAIGDGAIVHEWVRLFAAMPVLGIVTLVLADRIAAQVDS